MIELTLMLSILSLAGITVYIIYNNKVEKISIIREITKAVKSKDITEYVSNIPEENEYVDPEEYQDEFQDVSEIDERILIKHLQNEK